MVYLKQRFSTLGTYIPGATQEVELGTLKYHNVMIAFGLVCTPLLKD